jgi:hypothetical protein
MEWEASKAQYSTQILIFKVALSIFAGSHQSSQVPIDLKVFWGDGKQEKMESKRKWKVRGDGKRVDRILFIFTTSTNKQQHLFMS